MAPPSAVDVLACQPDTSLLSSDQPCGGEEVKLTLLELASREIEQLRAAENDDDDDPTTSSTQTMGRQPCSSSSPPLTRFPPACLALLQKMPGNQRCVDCGERNPTWAAASYGALLCLQCSGHHRSLGVQVSRVRSLHMDAWSLNQILGMLEGGNGQLQTFFARHELSEEALRQRPKAPHDDNNDDEEATHPTTITKKNVTRLRYKTKAALFYRQQMALHVDRVLQAGPYRGREISRRLKHHRLDHRNSTLE